MSAVPSSPVPGATLNPVRPTDPGMVERLAAAESDTGVALGQRVTVPKTNHGVLSVVGFARVNVPGIDEPIRAVAVADPDALRLHGIETVILFTPDRLSPTPTPTDRDPPPQ